MAEVLVLMARFIQVKSTRLFWLLSLILTNTSSLPSILMDVYADRTKFSGKRGRDQDGNPAEIGSGSSDVLSLAPALEWNFTENLGIIGGVWFSLTGRNSEDFISYVFSVNVVY